jgi:hypothetical protein
MSAGFSADRSGAAAPHSWSAVELQQIIRTERLGLPFLVWRNSAGVQQLFPLGAESRVSIGRHASNRLALADDGEVSRTHAELELVGADWTISDDGLSRNGTWLNGNRLAGRQRLRDRDRLRFGRTTVEYRYPADALAELTVTGAESGAVVTITETQRRVLVALCRPYRDGDAYATPASNSDIAAEVFLGVDAVKNHLRQLFQRFGLAELPQNQKRARLAETVIRTGLVSERDF